METLTEWCFLSRLVSHHIDSYCNIYIYIQVPGQMDLHRIIVLFSSWQFPSRNIFWFRSTAILRAAVAIVRAGMRHPDQLKCLVSDLFSYFLKVHALPVIGKATIFQLKTVVGK